MAIFVHRLRFLIMVGCWQLAEGVVTLRTATNFVSDIDSSIIWHYLNTTVRVKPTHSTTRHLQNTRSTEILPQLEVMQAHRTAAPVVYATVGSA
jgi:hypothetical protein